MLNAKFFKMFDENALRLLKGSSQGKRVKGKRWNLWSLCFPLMPNVFSAKSGEGAGWLVAKERGENLGFCLLPTTHKLIGKF